MKNFLKIFMIFLFIGAFASCTSVDSNERGIKKNWGGEIDMTTTYQPGLSIGLHWMWDDMITFNVSQQTIVEKYDFNDKNNMETGVEVALDYSINPETVAKFYTKISSPDVKLAKTLKSACKEVIPQYTAAELNLTKRNEAEEKLATILSKELPEFYMMFDRVQLTDVDIPKNISEAAEKTAKQAELNKLAEAKVVEAKNNLDAAEFDAKTKAILSQPAMLAMRQLEIQSRLADAQFEFAKKGVSPYGENNVFGDVSILKGFK